MKAIWLRGKSNIIQRVTPHKKSTEIKLLLSKESKYKTILITEWHQQYMQHLNINGQKLSSNLVTKNATYVKWDKVAGEKTTERRKLKKLMIDEIMDKMVQRY